MQETLLAIRRVFIWEKLLKYYFFFQTQESKNKDQKAYKYLMKRQRTDSYFSAGSM